MTRGARFRGPKPNRRRALELLAGCAVEGCSEAVMRTAVAARFQAVEHDAGDKMAAVKRDDGKFIICGFDPEGYIYDSL